MTVLVGVDGSTASLDALDLALREAALRNTTVRMVYADPWPAHPAWIDTPRPGPATGAKEALRAARDHSSAEFTTEVIDGDPGTVLIRESAGAHLAVVAHRGHGGFPELLLGSVAVKVAAHASCPVFVTRGTVDPASAAARRGAAARDDADARPNVDAGGRGEAGIDPQGKGGVDPQGDLDVEPRGGVGVGPRGDLDVEPWGEAGVGPRGDLDVEPWGEAGVGPRGDLGAGLRGAVGVGVDGSPATDAAVGFAFEEAALRGVGVVAVHASIGPYLSGPTDALIFDPKAERAEQHRLLTAALAPWRKQHPDVPVREEVRWDRPTRALIELSTRVSLLAVGRRGRSGLPGRRLGSVTHALLHHAACPVAVVPT